MASTRRPGSTPPDGWDAAATPGGPMSERAVPFRPLFRTLSLLLVAACGEENPLVPPPPPNGMSTILVTLNTTGTKPDSNGYRIVVDQGASSHAVAASRSEEHTSELQSQSNLVCRL